MSPKASYKKSLTTAPKTPKEVQIRDTFLTPKYAVDLLVPFIPKGIQWIWECAAGDGRISDRLKHFGYNTFRSDIRENLEKKVSYFDFLECKANDPISLIECIITNPPFSVKDDFVEMAFTYNIPFAFLINADYSGQSVEWIRRGCEKIVPTSRIAYITPNILRRIHEGEVWNLVKNDYPNFTFKTIKEHGTDVWGYELDKHKDVHNYKSIDEVPNMYLYKYSSAQFHSMWLTYGFKIGRTETFVDLSVEERKNNI